MMYFIESRSIEAHNYIVYSNSKTTQLKLAPEQNGQTCCDILSFKTRNFRVDS